jgi:hypothetical protein
MSSIIDQLTELYVFVDDFLTAHPALAQWRQSPHDTPDFADAEVLTLALLQGCWGVASLKQTYSFGGPQRPFGFSAAVFLSAMDRSPAGPDRTAQRFAH